MDRKTGMLNIVNLHLETEELDGFIAELKNALVKFLSFNKGTNIRILKITSNSQKLSARKKKIITDRLRVDDIFQ